MCRLRESGSALHQHLNPCEPMESGRWLNRCALEDPVLGREEYKSTPRILAPVSLMHIPRDSLLYKTHSRTFTTEKT